LGEHPAATRNPSATIARAKHPRAPNRFGDAGHVLFAGPLGVAMNGESGPTGPSSCGCRGLRFLYIQELVATIIVCVREPAKCCSVALEKSRGLRTLRDKGFRPSSVGGIRTSAACLCATLSIEIK
jgi:hypothetical protein